MVGGVGRGDAAGGGIAVVVHTRIKSAKIFVGILGSGAREHAMAWRLQQDLKGRSVSFGFFPGNDYLARLGACVRSLEQLITLAQDSGASQKLLLTGSEVYAGQTDSWRDQPGWVVWGPTLAAAQLEWSKVFSKQWMEKHDIPTAKCFGVTKNETEISKIVEKAKQTVVMKYDGLLGGKGVAIVNTAKEAQDFFRSVKQLAGKVFNSTFVLEEKLEGIERSLFLFLDTQGHVQAGPLSMDFKRKYDGDRGPNTGGMGTFTPAPGVWDLRDVCDAIAEGLQKSKLSYAGVLYVGLMMTRQGPKVLEFNVRLGDPEAQTFLPALQTSFYDVIVRGDQGKLTEPIVAQPGKLFGGIVCATRDYAEMAKNDTDTLHSAWFEACPYHVFFGGIVSGKDEAFEVRSGRMVTVVYEVDIDAAPERVLVKEADVIRWIEKQGWKHIHLRRDLAKQYLIQKDREL